jgi:hypothetical protein
MTVVHVLQWARSGRWPILVVFRHRLAAAVAGAAIEINCGPGVLTLRMRSTVAAETDRGKKHKAHARCLVALWPLGGLIGRMR